MWVRKRFDIGWADIAYGIAACFLPGTPAAVAAALERRWHSDGSALACLSVRSGFDLLLQTLDLPRGSEVLVSAVTIPHMLDILREHGLVPVPIDFDLRSMSLDRAALERAMNARTRAVLVAHLFGSRMTLDAVVELCRAHGLLLIEDCAQAFCGAEYQGHPQADVTMFSFGAIKTATAFGGALLGVRDPELLARMRTRHARWPVQSRAYYLRRLLKYAALKPLEHRWPYGAGHKLLPRLGIDFDSLINALARGFSGADFFHKIQRRPSRPLLALLTRRIERFDPLSHASHVSINQRLAELMPDVERPGDGAEVQKFWMFPLLADQPERFAHRLRSRGYDATRGATALAVLEPPLDRPELEPRKARAAMARVVYVPVHPSMPQAARDELAQVVRGALDQSNRTETQTTSRPG